MTSSENKAIWQMSGGSYNTLRPQGYAPFLTAAQQARLERIRQARMLFRGDHRTYYVTENRSQFPVPELRGPDGQVRQVYVTNNLLRLVSLKSADLLFGQEPLLNVEDDLVESRIKDIAERSMLHPLLYSQALDCSYEAEAMVEAIIADNQVYLRRVDAAAVFPEGTLRPDHQYASYVGYEIQNIGTAETPVWLMLETRWTAGAIERNCWQMDGTLTTRRRVTMASWPAYATDTPPDVQSTGIDMPTITWVPNLLVQGEPSSDYDGVIELQDQLNTKQSQLAVVLAKHSEPGLAVPQDARDEQGNLRSDHKVYFFRTKDEIPQYITWESQLDAAMKDRAFAVNQLLIQTETSPVLLGLKEGAAPDAYKKVRLEAFNSLTKAGRKAAYWRPAVRRMLDVAMALEQTVPGSRYDRMPAAVDLRDGIPVDDADQANTIATLKAAGAMSTRRAVQMQLVDEAAVEKELAELETEKSAAAPAIMFGEQASEPRPSGSGATENTEEMSQQKPAAREVEAAKS